jgi:peptidoglycan/xylan/chitin deacetylase (PgdA/CDA1 family)
MYHGINTVDRYGAAGSVFEEQVRYLYEHAYTSLVPEDIAALKSDPSKRYVMITFDDGHETDFTVAYPLLYKYGFKCVSFITTGFVGQKGYVSWRQLRELKENGFSVQSHTHRHLLLNTASQHSIREELYISKKSLEDKIGSPVTSLAFPGGGYNRKVSDTAWEEGYQYLFTSEPGMNIVMNDTRGIFRRIRVSNRTNIEKFQRILNGDKRVYRAMIAGYHVRNAAKKVIGSRRYHRLWSAYYKY